jgi:murein endopeptidase
MKQMVLSVQIFLLLMTACVQTENQGDQMHEDQVSEDQTKEVLDHHWLAFKANDLEETMKDYTEESVLITPNRTLSTPSKPFQKTRLVLRWIRQLL